MSRVTISRTQNGQKRLRTEIARLRDLNTKELHACWRILFRRPAPPHLSDHLLFRILAFRLQVNQHGDLDNKSLRLLNGPGLAEPAGGQAPLLKATVEQGSILSREWNSRMHRVTVLSNGFAWNGKIYASLSKVAFAITGTRWNGPRFFGLRDRPKARSSGSP